MAAAAGLEASPTKFMSPTRNGVPLPYPIGIAPLNLHSRDGGLVLALTAIVIAAATQNGGIRTHQLLSATVEYQTDALFQRSLRPAKKGRPELAPQRGGESAAPRESPHSSIIANGRSDSSGSPSRQRRKFHRPRRATATAAATALPGVIATDGVIATNGVIAALGVIRATNGAIRAALGVIRATNGDRARRTIDGIDSLCPSQACQQIEARRDVASRDC